MQNDPDKSGYDGKCSAWIRILTGIFEQKYIQLDREYDQAGLNDWVGQLNSGVGREQVFHGFAGSTEFHNLMAEYGVD